MPDWIHERGRKLHLDFHTPPWVRIADDFDAGAFARDLKRAHVCVVVLFAKDVYGSAYYDTKLGTRHPGLSFDLLNRQVDACHQHDIKVMAYYSVAWDRIVAEAHPNWQQVDRHGEPILMDRREPMICLSTPYLHEVILPRIEELLGDYPELDGLWFDAVAMSDRGCWCRWCQGKRQMRHVDEDAAEAMRGFNGDTVESFVTMVTGKVKSLAGDLPVVYNGLVAIGARRFARMQDLFEIQLSGGTEGLLWMGLLARHVRLLGNPCNGLTSRFTPGWTQFGTLKTDSQLKFECASMLAHGLTCSVADQPEPSLRLDADAYKRLGHVYEWVKDREPWSRGATSAAEGAVLWTGAPTSAPDTMALLGAVKLLTESQCPFDVLDESFDLGAYRWVVVASLGVLSEAGADRVARYLHAGGRVLAAVPRRPSAEAVQHGLALTLTQHPDTGTAYLCELDRSIRSGLAPGALAVPGDSVAVRHPGDGQTLAQMCSPLGGPGGEHEFGFYPAPPDRTRAVPGVVKLPVGSGVLVLVCCDLFGAYFNTGDPNTRRLGRNLLDVLHPRRERLVAVEAPSWVEVSLMKTTDRYILHLLNLHTERRGGHASVIDEVPPVDHITVRLRVPHKPVQVYLAPGRDDIDFQFRAGRLTCVVPRLDLHRMLVVAMQVED